MDRSRDLPALAVHAARSGEIINGVPVVAVGGRSLSLATGRPSETTVWDFLRTVRDQPGAPLVRTRIAQGREADCYALTRQNPAPVDDAAIASARVENVHLAWKVIGHRHRRIYELIVHRGLSNPDDICAAAHVSTSTGYTTLAALATAGLIRRSRGAVACGPISLDVIAAAHHLDLTSAPNGSPGTSANEPYGTTGWRSATPYAICQLPVTPRPTRSRHTTHRPTTRNTLLQLWPPAHHRRMSSTRCSTW